jgi:hypothetical protein
VSEHEVGGGIFDIDDDEIEALEERHRKDNLERLRPDERIHQQFGEPRPLAMGMGPDGIPMPVNQEHVFVPPLALDTLVCLADNTRFVVRDQWGDLLAAFLPEEVERAPNGSWRVKLHRFIDAMGETWEEWEGSFAGIGDAADVIRKHLSVEYLVTRDWVEVQPIRPQCTHLSRQLTDSQGNPEAPTMERCCTARRDSGGEFMSVVDAQIAACELRDPRDPVSEQLLDDYDALKMKLGAERRRQGAGLNLEQVGVDPNEDLEGIVE